MATDAVKVTLFRWVGVWGPLNIKIPCGVCALTKDVIRDTLKHERAGVAVDLVIRDWLTEWWRPLIKGGWHAPIVMVEGRGYRRCRRAGGEVKTDRRSES